MKKIVFGVESQEKLKRGISNLSSAVKTTLGPSGKNILIQKEMGSVHITKDGVTVAKSIEFEDPLENMGAQLIKDVAQKTVEEAGDGTTTSCVLADAIYREGIKNVVAGANPLKLKKGIDLATEIVISYIKDTAKKVNENFDTIKDIATVSANNDSEIGFLVADGMRQVKNDGIVTVEESKGLETYITLVEGMQIDRGFTSPYFMNDEPNGECVLHNPLIFLHEGRIDSLKEILPLLNNVFRDNKVSLLLIADDFSSDLINALVINKIKGGLNICAVKSPGFGDRKKDMLKDISCLIGGTICDSANVKNFELYDSEDFGHAEKVVITKNSTTIINGKGKAEDIEVRKQQIKNQISQATESFDIEKLQERLAKLSGGVAILHVGANSEIEMKEKKDRVDDALCATKSAIEEGVIPGGGVAYLNSIVSIDHFLLKNNCDEDTKLGIKIVREAIQEPIKQIMYNAGEKADVIIEKILNEPMANYGYDAKGKQFGDLIELGIIDPAKVARVALENASSIVGTLLTTSCAIYTVNDKSSLSSAESLMY